MDLYPAIDIRGGRCVRLIRGDYDAEIVYDDDPVERARGFAAAGTGWIHVVDLDAAKSGDPVNHPVIERLCAAVDARVQVGGGIRSPEAAQRLWEAGAERVVVGTAAVREPEMVDSLVDACPGRVAVGVDARAGDVAVEGWTQGSGMELTELVERFDRPGVGALVVTAIERDGTMEGPEISLLSIVLATTSVDVVASGGVGSLDHVRELASLRAGGRELSGAIIGRALYEGRFDLEEALRACSPPG